MCRASFTLAVVQVLVSVCSCSAAEPQIWSRKVSQRLVIDASNLTVDWKRIRVSQNGLRMAVIVAGNPGETVYVDAVAHQRYDKIDSESICFSEDGSRVGYWAATREQQVVVVDGKEKAVCEKVHELAFSGNGRHFAYCGTRVGKEILGIDDKEQVLDGKVTGMEFCIDGSRFAYTVSVKGRDFPVLDGLRSEPADLVHGLVFSPDGRHLSYVAQTADEPPDRRVSVILDGKPCVTFTESVRGLVFSADSKRFAYGGRGLPGELPYKCHFVVDGKIVAGGFDSDSPCEPRFSPDGKRVAIVASKSDDERRSYYAGEPGSLGAAHDDIGGKTVAFSPDSKRIAFVAEDHLGEGNLACRLFIDGKQVQEHKGAFANFLDPGFIAGPVFSPDSKRIAYALQKYQPDEVLVLVDTVELGRFADVTSPLLFSPDSRHVLFVAESRQDHKQAVIVDSDRGKPFEKILLGDKGIVFDDAKSFHYLARAGQKVWLVTETLTEARPQE